MSPATIVLVVSGGYVRWGVTAHGGGRLIPPVKGTVLPATTAYGAPLTQRSILVGGACEL